MTLEFCEGCPCPGIYNPYAVDEGCSGPVIEKENVLMNMIDDLHPHGGQLLVEVIEHKRCGRAVLLEMRQGIEATDGG